ncbi:MAG: hypothetical protein A2746_01690 [Candidatus Yanofskybacteria bacterium RIFCSPHIGHO2_01_FULL_44_22]|uniref:HTH arsR-type domain-containing protein n=1 Tax=Candidatus Yanofskybacteria bacterium RIFCSPHIGHO2_01_FULL_44_22 TaxID=1802669 RepID=A0A1F8EUF8_9BACT|nr:MAG: hypothetical protein A2746_01690 [Candidatus Yanofskybacteria bacterium RIFCSPHIGHO2_01_FULL_44_22]
MSKKSNQPAKNTLNDLFGSKTRIKILKFLFRNYLSDFNAKDMAKKLQEADIAVNREIKMLVKIGLINKKK